MTDKYIHPDSLVGMRERLRQQAERIELLEKSLKFQIDLGDKFQAENARLKQELNKIKSFEKQRWEHIPAELRGGQDNETT